MFEVTVQFDKVMHVHRKRAFKAAPERTVFSFMSNYRYTPYVTVPGWPRLEDGMKVKALLRNPGDWHSLVGWRDLKTNELALPNPSHFFSTSISILSACVFVMLMVALGPSLPVGLLVTLGLVIVVLGYYSYAWYRNWRTAQSDVVAIRALGAIDET